MNTISMINRIEETYCIGFKTKSNKDELILKLADSDDDKFEIKVRVTPQIRLSIAVTIEKYGASFLHLINKSDTNKRRQLVEFAKKNNKGDISIYINKNKIELDDFINNNLEWNDFKIQFNEVPFEENEDEVVRALTLLIGMMFTLFNYSIEGFEEGNKEDIHISRYERNPVNKQICLAYKGYKCVICGFDFEKTYGEVGKNTIEVHHTTPVSKMGIGYVVNPIEELIPVCSNCHTIIHKRKMPYTVEEVKQMISENNIQKD